MSGSGPRQRTLILGCDYPTFHLYWRYYAQQPDREILGFVYCFDGEPPISRFKGQYRLPCKIYAYHRLERTIIEKRIQKCVIQVQNVPMPEVQSIINRVLSTGTCSVEFIPLIKDVAAKSFKPLIVVSSLAPKLGKSQLARYFTTVLRSNMKRVAVIYPLPIILPQSDVLVIEQCPHYEFDQDEEIPDDVFTLEDKAQIENYQKSGAFKIFATADTRRAIIRAEQTADVIIFDSHSCEQHYISAKSRFCVISSETIERVRRHSLWPGLINVLDSSCICVLSNTQVPIPKERRKQIEGLLKEHKVFYATSQVVFSESSGQELFGRSVLAVDHDDNPNIALNAALSKGASYEDSAKITTTLPRQLSPTVFTIEQQNQTLGQLRNMINKSDAEVVVVSIGAKIPGLDPLKTVLSTTPEIDDRDGKLYEWLQQFFGVHPPTLKEHFEEQTDILQALSTTSDYELAVGNNDSANKEAFVRLFLRAHLPSGFRVTTGEVIDCYLNGTGQLDVIIVNDVCPTLTMDGSGDVIAPIPADNVLSVLEVKTTLTSDSLKKALQQLRPVKALMPMHATLQNADGSIIRDPLGGKIITGIFSFSLGSSNFEQRIPGILDMFPNVADFIVVPGKFGFFSARTLNVCGIDTGAGNEVIGGYVKYSAKGMGLAMIFGVLNALAAIRRFSGLNCVRYLSGSWGDPHETVARDLIDAKEKIGRLDPFVVKLDPNTRKEFFRVRSRLIDQIKVFEEAQAMKVKGRRKQDD